MTLQATRRLTDIKFEHDGAAVALVSKKQGGPANGRSTLVFKSTSHIDQSIIEKASQVTVTLDFDDFLCKFFNMYWEDAEVLSRALGMDDDTDEEDAEEIDSYQAYIDARVASINIMKSVYSSQNVLKSVGSLKPEQQLALMQDQELLEKAMSSALPQGETLNKQTLNGEQMETILKSAHEEFVTKAVADAVAIEKAAYAAQEVVLKAAQDKLAEFEAAAQASIEKARKESLAAVVAEDRVEALYKSLASVDDAAFTEVVTSLAVAKAATDSLFTETGVTGAGEQDPAKVDATAAILKAKYAK